MNKNILSYENQEVYLGIDVHRNKYAVSAVVKGEQVDNFIYNNGEDSFVEMLKNRYKRAKRVKCCYEAGFSGFSLSRKLKFVGYECIVVHPGLVSVTSMKRKTDKRDATQMSMQLYSGMLKSIHIPSPEEEDNRRLTRLRKNLVCDQTRLKCRIRMLYNYYQILETDQNGVLSYLRAQRIYNINLNNFGEGFRVEIGQYLDNWQYLKTQINKLNKKIKELSEKEEAIDKYYLSIPGFGILTSRTLAVELADIGRFKNVKSLYSYVGLTPSEFSSGENQRRGHISKEGKPFLRRILIQAAWKATSEDKFLQERYIKLKQTKGGKRAIVAIARYLLGVARCCAINKSFYVMPKLVNKEQKEAA